MHTISYRGWWIHETFLSDAVRPATVQNGITVVSPSGDRFPVNSMHAAKCLITRQQAAAHPVET